MLTERNDAHSKENAYNIHWAHWATDSSIYIVILL